ncbi:unnamed protein product [Amoebophrya sp. A120]|nr:unnamed protein product [Amoebophrya sp. A120]|eukprot:GSA120T00008361001.1
MFRPPKSEANRETEHYLDTVMQFEADRIAKEKGRVSALGGEINAAPPGETKTEYENGNDHSTPGGSSVHHPGAFLELWEGSNENGDSTTESGTTPRFTRGKKKTRNGTSSRQGWDDVDEGSSRQGNKNGAHGYHVETESKTTIKHADHDRLDFNSCDQPFDCEKHSITANLQAEDALPELLLHREHIGCAVPRQMSMLELVDLKAATVHEARMEDLRANLPMERDSGGGGEDDIGQRSSPGEAGTDAGGGLESKRKLEEEEAASFLEANDIAETTWPAGRESTRSTEGDADVDDADDKMISFAPPREWSQHKPRTSGAEDEAGFAISQPGSSFLDLSASSNDLEDARKQLQEEQVNEDYGRGQQLLALVPSPATTSFLQRLSRKPVYKASQLNYFTFCKGSKEGESRYGRSLNAPEELYLDTVKFLYRHGRNREQIAVVSPVAADSMLRKRWEDAKQAHSANGPEIRILQQSLEHMGWQMPSELETFGHSYCHDVARCTADQIDDCEHRIWLEIVDAFVGAVFVEPSHTSRKVCNNLSEGDVMQRLLDEAKNLKTGSSLGESGSPACKRVCGIRGGEEGDSGSSEPPSKQDGDEENEKEDSGGGKEDEKASKESTSKVEDEGKNKEEEKSEEHKEDEQKDGAGSEAQDQKDEESGTGGGDDAGSTTSSGHEEEESADGSKGEEGGEKEGEEGSSSFSSFLQVGEHELLRNRKGEDGDSKPSEDDEQGASSEKKDKDDNIVTAAAKAVVDPIVRLISDDRDDKKSSSEKKDKEGGNDPTSGDSTETGVKTTTEQGSEQPNAAVAVDPALRRPLVPITSAALDGFHFEDDSPGIDFDNWKKVPVALDGELEACRRLGAYLDLELDPTSHTDWEREAKTQEFSFFHDAEQKVREAKKQAILQYPAYTNVEEENQNAKSEDAATNTVVDVFKVIEETYYQRFRLYNHWQLMGECEKANALTPRFLPQLSLDQIDRLLRPDAAVVVNSELDWEELEQAQKKSGSDYDGFWGEARHSFPTECTAWNFYARIATLREMKTHFLQMITVYGSELVQTLIEKSTMQLLSSLSDTGAEEPFIKKLLAYGKKKDRDRFFFYYLEHPMELWSGSVWQHFTNTNSQIEQNLMSMTMDYCEKFMVPPKTYCVDFYNLPDKVCPLNTCTRRYLLLLAATSKAYEAIFEKEFYQGDHRDPELAKISQPVSTNLVSRLYGVPDNRYTKQSAEIHTYHPLSDTTSGGELGSDYDGRDGKRWKDAGLKFRHKHLSDEGEPIADALQNLFMQASQKIQDRIRRLDSDYQDASDNSCEQRELDEWIKSDAAQATAVENRVRNVLEKEAPQLQKEYLQAKHDAGFKLGDAMKDRAKLYERKREELEQIQKEFETAEKLQKQADPENFLIREKVQSTVNELRETLRRMQTDIELRESEVTSIEEEKKTMLEALESELKNLLTANQDQAERLKKIDIVKNAARCFPKGANSRWRTDDSKKVQESKAGGSFQAKQKVVYDPQMENSEEAKRLQEKTEASESSSGVRKYLMRGVLQEQVDGRDGLWRLKLDSELITRVVSEKALERLFHKGYVVKLANHAQCGGRLYTLVSDAGDASWDVAEFDPKSATFPGVESGGGGDEGTSAASGEEGEQDFSEKQTTSSTAAGETSAEVQEEGAREESQPAAPSSFAQTGEKTYVAGPPAAARRISSSVSASAKNMASTTTFNIPPAETSTSHRPPTGGQQRRKQGNLRGSGYYVAVDSAIAAETEKSLAAFVENKEQTFLEKVAGAVVSKISSFTGFVKKTVFGRDGDNSSSSRRMETKTPELRPSAALEQKVKKRKKTKSNALNQDGIAPGTGDQASVELPQLSPNSVSGMISEEQQACAFLNKIPERDLQLITSALSTPKEKNPSRVKLLTEIAEKKERESTEGLEIVAQKVKAAADILPATLFKENEKIKKLEEIDAAMTSFKEKEEILKQAQEEINNVLQDPNVALSDTEQKTFEDLRENLETAATAVSDADNAVEVAKQAAVEAGVEEGEEKNPEDSNPASLEGKFNDANAKDDKARKEEKENQESSWSDNGVVLIIVFVVLVALLLAVAGYYHKLVFSNNRANSVLGVALVPRSATSSDTKIDLQATAEAGLTVGARVVHVEHSASDEAQFGRIGMLQGCNAEGFSIVAFGDLGSGSSATVGAGASAAVQLEALPQQEVYKLDDFTVGQKVIYKNPGFSGGTRGNNSNSARGSSSGAEYLLGRISGFASTSAAANFQWKIRKEASGEELEVAATELNFQEAGAVRNAKCELLGSSEQVRLVKHQDPILLVEKLDEAKDVFTDSLRLSSAPGSASTVAIVATDLRPLVLPGKIEYKPGDAVKTAKGEGILLSFTFPYGPWKLRLGQTGQAVDVDLADLSPGGDAEDVERDLEMQEAEKMRDIQVDANANQADILAERERFQTVLDHLRELESGSDPHLDRAMIATEIARVKKQLATLDNWIESSSEGGTSPGGVVSNPSVQMGIASERG